jgi:signal transduction histidine kinase/ligand-binding sensor domain-containing protein
LALLLSLPLTAATLPELSVRGWTARDELPDDRVLDIIQDTSGFLYIATYAGVAQFDGVHFTPISAPQLPTAGRTLAKVLCADPNGGIWAGLAKGTVVLLQREHGRAFSLADGLPDDTPRSLCPDGEGGVFVGFLNRGLARIQGNRVERFTKVDGSEPTGRCCLCRDSRGTIWCSDANGLWEYRAGHFLRRADVGGFSELAAAADGGIWLGEPSRIRKFQAGQGYVVDIQIPEGFGELMALHEDQTGVLWVGIRNGRHGGLLRLADGTLHPTGLALPEVTSVTGDNEGNIWAGSPGLGIRRLQFRLMRVEQPAGDATADQIQGFTLDEQQNPWVVRRDWRVLHRVGSSSWRGVATFAPTEIRATSIAADRDIYIGTRGHGVFRIKSDRAEPVPGTAHGDDAIFAILPGKADSLWLSFSSGLLRRIAPEGVAEWQLPSSTTSRILVRGKDDEVWVAAGGGRLFRVSGADGLREVTLPEAGLFALRALWCDPDGTLWFGLGGGGIARWKNGQWTRITAEQGLLDDFVSQLVKDRNGWLWVASHRGVSRVDPGDIDRFAAGRKSTVRIAQFPLGEDTNVSLGSEHECALAANGELWFAGQTGLLVVDPPNAPSGLARSTMVVKAVRLGGQLIRDDRWRTAVLALPPELATLEIDYTMPHFSFPENVDYRVWMEGLDDTWSDVGRTRRAVYSRLPPGKYRFRAAARALDGIWVEAPPLAIVVTRHFWQTWPFAVAALGAALGVGALATRRLMHRRLRRQQAALEREQQWSRERARIARDMHDDLGSSLIHLALLGDLAGDAQAAAGEKDRNVAQMATMARQLAKHLQEVVWSINPEHDTLTAVANYLGQYTSELARASGIFCVLEIPSVLPDSTLSSAARHHLLLAVREGLNNVIRHSGATEVNLGIQATTARLVVTLRDNGSGFDAAVGRAGGNGLGNMRQRLASIGGTCTFAAVAPHGTYVTFDVPLARIAAL